MFLPSSVCSFGTVDYSNSYEQILMKCLEMLDGLRF